MLDVVKNKNIFFAIPLLIIIAAIIVYIVAGGFVLGIDFAGGSEMVMDIKTKVDKAEVAKVFKDALGKEPASVQPSLINDSEVTVKSATLSQDEVEKVWDAFKTKYNLEDSDRLSMNNISPTIGKELSKGAIVAAIVAIILMLIYISFRFEFLSGVAAIIALIHNVLILLSAYIILRMPLDTTFIAAILTVIGYSINDTIVIFDRTRENVKFSKRESFAVLSNRSVNQSLTRTINTSITTLITIVLLYFLGVSAIKNFALALVIGVICGTYSSICIATPIWVMLRGDKGQAPAKKKA